MQRSSLLRWLIIGAVAILFFQFVWPRIMGHGGAPELQPLGGADYGFAPERKVEALCELKAPRFEAKLSSQGASLRSVKLLDQKYSLKVEQPDTRIDLVTPTLEYRMPLRTNLRLPAGGADQVPVADLDFDLAEQTDRACTFVYKDEGVEVTKVVSLTERPFELDVQMTVKNLAAEPKKHRLAIEQTSWRTTHELEGSLGRLPEYETETVVHTSTVQKRHKHGDFDPGDFTDKEFTAEKWRREEGEARWVSTSSTYLALALFAKTSPAAPAGESLVEEYWDHTKFKAKKDDPQSSYVFRSRLAYPEKELATGESASYEALAFVGPKERDVVTHIGGVENATKWDTGGLMNMEIFIFGNLFTNTLGKWLIDYVYWLFKMVGSWGWAICLLTLTVKIVVFPLSIPQLRSSVGMRRIKPQMDEITAKYKDSATERTLAMQELWRKEGISNPMIGCLPVLLQMPVWLTLFAALRSSAELYHTSFGPLIPDLSEPGKYFVIPLLLGVLSFVQQKLIMQSGMPGGDPMQQKMMLYMMPVMFTVLNIFMPAGIGVYWLTNTVLTIFQQLLTERWVMSKLAAEKAGTIQVREKASAPAASIDSGSPIRKGKARAGG